MPFFPTIARACLLVLCVCYAPPSKADDIDNPETAASHQRGIERVSAPEMKPEGYPKSWALIVGINYKDTKLDEAGRNTIKGLENAEKDALAVAELLKEHYGYSHDHMKILIGKDATREAIQEALSGGFLGKKYNVGEKDSVLFYFAGHGFPPDQDQRTGELIPWDVKVEGDTPIQATCIPMEDQVVKYLRASPAKHKLVILDCCHAGDIFTQTRQAKRRIGSDLQADAGLFHTAAFQAIASCRREQQTPDGKDGHSPFTSALLSAMKVIPRQQGTRNPIKASDLFTYMEFDLQSSLLHDHNADLGWLSPDQGEFHFFPNPKSDFNRYSSFSGDEMLTAIAMAPGTHGAWWFDEMPWFIPSLRYQILANKEALRSTTSESVNKRQLEKSAYEILQQLENNRKEGIDELRIRHLRLLLDPSTRQNPELVYKQIVRELRTPSQTTHLAASDIHLLAALEHRLGEAAEQTYTRALNHYDLAIKNGHKHNNELRLLCLADLGQYKIQSSDYEQAAMAYQRALEHRVLRPVPFQIYALCCEANAWQQLGRWGEADFKLNQALDLALPLADPTRGSPLTAYVYTRRAWCCMEQWRFQEAEYAFAKAESHLPKESDCETEIIRFHNRHGLAMARRFSGDPAEALAEYRNISSDIRDIFAKLRHDSGVEKNYGEIRERLTERLVNTLERQADCNLFRENGDLKEASDDLRRALRVADYFVPARRGPVKAALLYKQAMALGHRSLYQDLELAQGCLREAETIVDSLNDEQQRRLKYFRKLATAIVDTSAQLNAAQEEPGSEMERKQRCLMALTGLRSTINELRPQLNQSIHRDHLEGLLFATQYLVTENLDLADRYHLLSDAETLLLLCRHTMRNQRIALRRDGSQSSTTDEKTVNLDYPLAPTPTQRYLRHHFDTVIRAMIAAQPKHVQGMIEAAYEARIGRHYDKPERPAPCLVFYQLDERFHAFLDVPLGISKVYLFDESVTVETLHEAESNKKKIPLPKQLVKDLANLKLDKACFPEITNLRDANIAGALNVCWQDTCRGFGGIPGDSEMEKEFSKRSRSIVQMPNPIYKFPFELPGLNFLEDKSLQIISTTTKD
jgi:hypothetical protein